MKRHLENNTSPPAPTCWQREAPSACLRVETSDGEVHLFPYGQFVTASLVRAEDSEAMRITFATHDVEITGHNLWELLHVLQDFAVKWVRVFPKRYQSLDNTEGCKVTKIWDYCRRLNREENHSQPVTKAAILRE
jgi:hypothetical protein